jgi:hypothetical protein
MARMEEEMSELVVEQASEARLEGETGKNPTVLSCGGIFIPRPKPMGPNDEIYKILNVANQKEPTKVVCGPMTLNLLQDVLHKESMN